MLVNKAYRMTVLKFRFGGAGHVHSSDATYWILQSAMERYVYRLMGTAHKDIHEIY